MGAHKSKYGHEHEHDENIPPDGQEQQEVAVVDEQEVRINEINARMEERRLWSRLPCDVEVFDVCTSSLPLFPPLSSPPSSFICFYSSLITKY